jgi:predicted porin
MKKNNSLKFAILAICAIFAVSFMTTSAFAASWDAGDWKVSLGGNINAFYVYTMVDGDDLETGLPTMATLAGVGATDKDGKLEDTSSVQNGLLPCSLNFSASTNQNGWDISANVNVYYGIDSAGANGDQVGVLGDGDQGDASNPGAATSNPDALKFSSVDARQVFMTVGQKDLGTFKLGRDFGIFAFDAIINDMSLIGVGAGFVPSEPGHTTLGGLGFGYVYTDRLAQIDYMTPNWGGFQGTVGIFQGFDGVGANSADTPGFHGKVSYTWAGPVKLYGSCSGLYQDVVTTAANGATDEAIWGVDFCLKVDVADFSVLGYYYTAEGMTSLAIGGLIFPGFDLTTGDPEETDGYMVQATYTLGKVRFGANWAQNTQDKVTRIDNEKITLGVFYTLTPSLTILAEYSHQKSELKDADLDDTTSSFDFGAILFF